VLAGEDGLVEKIEACLFSTLDAVLLAQFQVWRWNDLCLDLLHVLVHFDAHLLESTQLLYLPQLVHESADFLMLVVRGLDGRL
jgi:hypothetical protein